MMTFNGSSQWLTSDNIFYPPSTKNATVTFWVQPSTLSGSKRILGFDSYWEIRFSGTTLLNELYQPNSPAQATGFSTGVMYHVACSYVNRGIDDSSIYVNGEFVMSTTGGSVFITNRKLQLGNSNWSYGNEAYAGTLGDVRIYDRALSGEEIGTIYALNGKDWILDGLVLWVPMDEKAPGTTPEAGGVKDHMGNTAGNYSPTGSPTYSASHVNSVRI